MPHSLLFMFVGPATLRPNNNSPPIVEYTGDEAPTVATPGAVWSGKLKLIVRDPD